MENTDKDHVAIDITILIMSSDEIQGDQKASMTNCMESDALPKTYTKPKWNTRLKWDNMDMVWQQKEI